MSNVNAALPSSTPECLLGLIERLYKQELNVGFQTDWDGGVHVWIGHYHYGRKAEKWFSIEELGETVEWIDTQATLVLESPPSADELEAAAAVEIVQAKTTVDAGMRR
jgi:hypothetical protein